MSLRTVLESCVDGRFAPGDGFATGRSRNGINSFCVDRKKLEKLAAKASQKRDKLLKLSTSSWEITYAISSGCPKRV